MVWQLTVGPQHLETRLEGPCGGGHVVRDMSGGRKAREAAVQVDPVRQEREAQELSESRWVGQQLAVAQGHRVDRWGSNVAALCVEEEVGNCSLEGTISAQARGPPPARR